MTALRLVGTFFLVVCGWCAGDAVCIRTQEHLEALRQTIALLEEIEQEITFRRADLNMLAKKLQREHKLFCSAKMIQTAIPPQSFSPQEAACFAECFSALAIRKQNRRAAGWHFIKSASAAFCSNRKKLRRAAWCLPRNSGYFLDLRQPFSFFKAQNFVSNTGRKPGNGN